MKRFISDFFKSFFVITTGTLFATAISITITYLAGGNLVMPWYLPWQILIFSAALTFITALILGSLDFSKKEMLIRMIIHFFVLLTVGIALAYYFEWIEFDSLISLIYFILLVCFIYLGVTLILSHYEQKTADVLNKRLKEFQQKK